MVRRHARWLGALVAAAVAFVPAVIQAQGGRAGAPSPAAGASRPTGERTIYTHPKRGFVLPLPPAADFEERPPHGHLHVQSRKGYVFSVQTADANPSVAFDAMFGKLEAQNLGRDRRWLRKISSQDARLAGLPAREAIYEGPSTRTRVVLARGARTDFVIMFFAPPDQYESLIGEFEWVLSNFRPGPGEGTGAAAPSAPPKSVVAPPPPPAVSPPAAPLAVPAPGEAKVAAPPVAASSVKPALPALTQRFADQSLGFVVSYPFDWVTAREGAFVVVFSGREGSPAFRATVSVQNVQPPAVKTPAEAIRATVADLKSQIQKSAAEYRFEAETPIAHGQGSTRLDGEQFLVSYRHGGEPFRKWTVVMPRPAGTVVHVWSYAAPAEIFDSFRPIAEAMLESWRIGAGG